MAIRLLRVLGSLHGMHIPFPNRVGKLYPSTCTVAAADAAALADCTAAVTALAAAVTALAAVAALAAALTALAAPTILARW